MSRVKLLVDTNVIIGLEDIEPVQSSFAELVRLSSENNVGLFVEGANYEDVRRDTNLTRRNITLSKLEKFQKLRESPSRTESQLVARYGPIQNENDKSDVRLLVALDSKAIDFLVTQDNGLHRRANRANLGPQVLTVEDALEWLRQTFQAKSIKLPYIVERKAYEISTDDPIFASIRLDYPNFDKWFDTCRLQHRDCWVLEIGGQIAGLVVRKDEDHNAAGTLHRGPKILKICTFKVRDDFRGEKFGELLLKQILWFAQRNSYDLTYLTAFDRHEFLVDLIKYYGFRCTLQNANGEIFFEKEITRGPLPTPVVNIYESDRLHYPRFHDNQSVRKFCVPIQPNYHRHLFPEIAVGTALPLFPEDVRLLDHHRERTPGNTIRKVYVCRAKISRLRPGDLIFFYMSKGAGHANSQSLTTVGIVGQVAQAASTEALIKLTAKRSVFTEAELASWHATPDSLVMVIDFLLVGHLNQRIDLKTLLQLGIFRQSPPQSITELDERRYSLLRSRMNLGFTV